jgi:oligopeptide transport system substrate-binding protein
MRLRLLSLFSDRPAWSVLGKRKIALGSIAWGMALILGGCGPSDPGARRLNTTEANEQGILLYNNGTEPQALDPQAVSGVPGVRILNALFQGLAAYPFETGGKPRPGAAERWEVSPDGTRWTFFLRPDGRWSNGDLVKASDFIFAWKRALTPSLRCDYVDWFFMIEGAEAFHRGEIPFEKVGLRAIDDLTLEIQLKAPTANVLEMLMWNPFLPVHEASVRAAGDPGAPNTGWTRPGKLVGNGPFQLVEWSPHVRIRVERNPHYWNAAEVKLNGIQFFPIDDERTSARAFESGLAHLTSTVPVNLRETYQREHPERIRFDDYAGIYYYRINTTREALSDPRVRHALSLALNREAITRQITRGGERPAFGYTPLGIAEYETPQPLRYDPKQARALLAEAGYPGGRGFPRLELLFNTSDNHRTIAEAVQAMWRDELQIDVQLQNMEWKTYLDTTQELNYDIARAGWIGSNFVNSFLRNYETASPNNETGYSDPVYDSLLEKARQTLDREARQAVFRAAEERLLEALPIIPIYWYKNIFFIDPAVQGWNPHLNDYRPYDYVFLEAPGLSQ